MWESSCISEFVCISTFHIHSYMASIVVAHISVKARSHGSFWDDIICHCELFEMVALMILKMRLMFWFYESHLSFRPLQCPTSKRFLCLHLNPFFQDLVQLHVQGLLAQSRKGERYIFCFATNHKSLRRLRMWNCKDKQTLIILVLSPQWRNVLLNS